MWCGGVESLPELTFANICREAFVYCKLLTNHLPHGVKTTWIFDCISGGGTLWTSTFPSIFRAFQHLFPQFWGRVTVGRLLPVRARVQIALPFRIFQIKRGQYRLKFPIFLVYKTSVISSDPPSFSSSFLPPSLHLLPFLKPWLMKTSPFFKDTHDFTSVLNKKQIDNREGRRFSDLPSLHLLSRGI